MKLEINKNRLISAVSKVEKITTKNTTLPILSCILLEAKNNKLEVKATNLDISIIIQNEAKIKEDGSALVPSQIFLNYLNNLPESNTTINLSKKEQNLNITTKTNETTIKTQPKDDYPEIKQKTKTDKTEIKSKDLVDGLKSVYYSASNSNIKPELSSVYIYQEENNFVFVATDSFRLAEKKIRNKIKNNFKETLIPFKNVVEIIKVFDQTEEVLDVFFDEDQIIIKSNETFLSSRIVDGTFPDYKQIIPTTSKTQVVVLKEDLIQNLRVANIFSGKFNQVIFSIFPKDNIFEIESTAQDIGETKNIVKSKTKGENIKIKFNNKYINDCFQSINSETLTLDFDGTDKPMRISGHEGDFLYLVMPMNK